MTTAVSQNSGRQSRWLSTVVLPLPRNPVSKTTGICVTGSDLGCSCYLLDSLGLNAELPVQQHDRRANRLQPHVIAVTRKNVPLLAQPTVTIRGGDVDRAHRVLGATAARAGVSGHSYSCICLRLLEKTKR